MRKRQFARIAVAAGVVGGALAVTVATPASAAGPSLTPDHTNRGADSFTSQNCDDEHFADRQVTEDGWRFFLPEGTADLVSLTVEFETGAGVYSVVVPAEAGLLDPADSKAAYLTTPAGWTLLGGTAEVGIGIGPAEQVLMVDYTCPGEPVSGPPTSTPVTPEPSATAPAPPVEQSRRGLPVTGMQVGAMVLLGSGLLAGGIAMLTVRRRRLAADLLDEL